MQDTVDDAAALNIPAVGEVELDELPKAAGVVVVHCLGVPKRLHDWTAEEEVTRSGFLSHSALCTHPLCRVKQTYQRQTAVSTTGE